MAKKATAEQIAFLVNSMDAHRENLASDLNALGKGPKKDVKEWRRGVDINAGIDGRLPIHYAADYGQKEVLSYLIEKGANIDAKDKYGISAILAAIWEGHTSCVKLMLEKGASRDGLTPDGTSYIDAAEKQEIKELLKC